MALCYGSPREPVCPATFVGCWVCVRHHSKCFQCVNSFVYHKCPMRQIRIMTSISQMRKPRCREAKPLVQGFPATKQLDRVVLRPTVCTLPCGPPRSRLGPVREVSTTRLRQATGDKVGWAQGQSKGGSQKHPSFLAREGVLAQGLQRKPGVGATGAVCTMGRGLQSASQAAKEGMIHPT